MFVRPDVWRARRSDSSPPPHLSVSSLQPLVAYSSPAAASPLSLTCPSLPGSSHHRCFRFLDIVIIIIKFVVVFLLVYLVVLFLSLLFPLSLHCDCSGQKHPPFPPSSASPTVASTCTEAINGVPKSLPHLSLTCSLFHRLPVTSLTPYHCLPLPPPPFPVTSLTPYHHLPLPPTP